MNRRLCLLFRKKWVSWADIDGKRDTPLGWPYRKLKGTHRWVNYELCDMRGTALYNTPNNLERYEDELRFDGGSNTAYLKPAKGHLWQ